MLVPTEVQAMILDKDNYCMVAESVVDGKEYGENFVHNGEWVTYVLSYFYFHFVRYIK